jgi:hypothetical protein
MRQFKHFFTSGAAALLFASCGATTAADGAATANDDAVTGDAGLDGGLDAAASDAGSSDAASVQDVVTKTCPQADLLLDVAKGQGAGSGYAKATLAGSCSDTTFTVTSNGMPFYSYVSMTPNALKTVSQSWAIPRFPQVADKTTEVPLLGVAGVTVSGLPFYGPTEATQPANQIYGDPVFNGLMDGCFGHTSPQEYHNHALAVKCLTAAALAVAEPWTLPDPAANEPSPIIGWALDGFPVYGPNGCVDAACKQVVTLKSGYVKTGDPTTYAWKAYTYTAVANDPSVLDVCNGRVGPDGTYRYHATTGFPYIIGCYKGTPSASSGGGLQPGDPGGGTGAPPSCSTDSDCTGKCGPSAQGCGCETIQNGAKGCIPTCTADGDCGPTPDGKTTTCKQGVCRP